MKLAKRKAHSQTQQLWLVDKKMSTNNYYL